MLAGRRASTNANVASYARGRTRISPHLEPRFQGYSRRHAHHLPFPPLPTTRITSAITRETPREAEKERRVKSCAALARKKKGAHPDGGYTHAHATPVSPRKTPDPPPGSAPVHLVQRGYEHLQTGAASAARHVQTGTLYVRRHTRSKDKQTGRRARPSDQGDPRRIKRDVKLRALRRETAREVYPPLLLPLSTHVRPARNGSEVENRGMLGRYLSILELEAMQVADGKLVAGRSK
ncbi:hypothetical protein K438DRAFT_1988154 [Mycena galopus ATCC 62051]|nr:hypothetical protein K438DRAFT_1988154 [Mycena galopus ATCC 62051]